jgi:hypothetical protein
VVGELSSGPETDCWVSLTANLGQGWLAVAGGQDLGGEAEVRLALRWIDRGLCVLECHRPTVAGILSDSDWAGRTGWVSRVA